MINKRRAKNIHKTAKKTSKQKQLKTKFPRKSRYTKKYLENRNSYRRKIIEKANETFKNDLSKINKNSETKMLLEEEPDFDNPRRKTLTFIEIPTYITIQNERFSSRNEKKPVYHQQKIEDLYLKSILKKT